MNCYKTRHGFLEIIYMKVFEHLLLFLRATRQQIWTLHLTSLHALSRYFFAYDMINYARFTPVYLAQMFALNEKDEEAWNFLNGGNFSVNKSNIARTLHYVLIMLLNKQTKQ